MSFVDLGLKPELVRAVTEKGYTEPTPIQAQAIPAVLAGRDVLAGAQTGTGKTAAFVLPVLQNLGQATGRAPRALVLTPTRELAAQVAESARAYGRYAGIRAVVVFGGVSINPQIDALRAGCDLLVATPGRLLDLAEQGAADLRSIECIVLDEADRMLDMGFLPAIRQVLKRLPQQRQNLMFSATYAEEIRTLAARILRNPVSVEVAPRNATADRVDQQVYRVSKEHKRHLLAHLIDTGNWHQVLVFTRTKHGANRLTQQLDAKGISAAAIHGNKSQGARVRALADFKSNKITALVATEVAARGLDIKELPHVVNYELPNVPEDYVHRIGRTARAGGSGAAVSLVSPDEGPLLKDIERLLKRTLPVTPLPQFSVSIPAASGANGSTRPVAGNDDRAALDDGAEHEDDHGHEVGNAFDGNTASEGQHVRDGRRDNRGQRPHGGGGQSNGARRSRNGQRSHGGQRFHQGQSSRDGHRSNSGQRSLGGQRSPDGQSRDGQRPNSGQRSFGGQRSHDGQRSGEAQRPQGGHNPQNGRRTFGGPTSQNSRRPSEGGGQAPRRHRSGGR